LPLLRHPPEDFIPGGRGPLLNLAPPARPPAVARRLGAGGRRVGRGRLKPALADLVGRAHERRPGIDGADPSDLLAPRLRAAGRVPPLHGGGGLGAAKRRPFALSATDDERPGLGPGPRQPLQAMHGGPPAEQRGEQALDFRLGQGHDHRWGPLLPEQRALGLGSLQALSQRYGLDLLALPAPLHRPGPLKGPEPRLISAPMKLRQPSQPLPRARCQPRPDIACPAQLEKQAPPLPPPR
jgi:hypothetical protein